MLHDIVRHRRRRRRRWAHAPVIHAASHVDHEKRVAWVPISMHTCGPFPIIMDALLGGPSGRRSSAIKHRLLHKPKGLWKAIDMATPWLQISRCSVKKQVNYNNQQFYQ